MSLKLGCIGHTPGELVTVSNENYSLYKEVLGHVLTHHNWCGNLMQLYEITSVVPQTGMLGWAASVHCQTERFHSTHSSH